MLLASAVVAIGLGKVSDGGGPMIVKGAPEVVLSRCGDGSAGLRRSIELRPW